MIPILILAAGRSSRMNGKDKLQMSLGTETLIERTVNRATATGHPVFMATQGSIRPPYALVSQLGVVCLDVPESIEGIGGTLRGAVKRLPPCDAFMITLGDLPDLETSDLTAVFQARHQNPQNLIWRGATQEGNLGHPSLFDASLRPEFDQLEGDKGASQLSKTHKDKTHAVPLTGRRAVLDLDTPEDWDQWCSGK